MRGRMAPVQASHRARSRRAPWSVLVSVMLFGSACTDHATTSSPTPGSGTSSAPTELGLRGCPQALQPGPSTGGLPEIRGRADSPVTLYGLLFAPYPIPARRDTKIAWRMTGSGPISFEALGPHGRRGHLDWGPEPHMGSSWRRPGDEWGTGFRFPAAGCWTVHVSRGHTSATTRLLVVNG